MVTAVPGHHRPAHRRGWGALLAAATVAVVVAAGFAGGVFGARLTSGTGTDLLAQLSSAVARRTARWSLGRWSRSRPVLLLSVLSSSSSSADEGSGIILTSDGMILTNNHVISGARSLQVRLNDGSTAQATVIRAEGTDDLAVIRAAGASALIPATLGTSADLRIGQAVVASAGAICDGDIQDRVRADRPVRTSSDQQQSPGLGQGQGQR